MTCRCLKLLLNTSIYNVIFKVSPQPENMVVVRLLFILFSHIRITFFNYRAVLCNIFKNISE